jgi:hypothetical protein
MNHKKKRATPDWLKKPALRLYPAEAAGVTLRIPRTSKLDKIVGRKAVAGYHASLDKNAARRAANQQRQAARVARITKRRGRKRVTDVVTHVVPT